MRLIDADRFIVDLGLDAEDAREINLGSLVTLEDFDRQPTIDMNNSWTSIYEAFPEENVNVLVTAKDKNTGELLITITQFGDAYWAGVKLNFKEWKAPFENFHKTYEVIAWMPLPEPYQEPDE